MKVKAHNVLQFVSLGWSKSLTFWLDFFFQICQISGLTVFSLLVSY